MIITIRLPAIVYVRMQLSCLHISFYITLFRPLYDDYLIFSVYSLDILACTDEIFETLKFLTPGRHHCPYRYTNVAH